MNNVLSINWKKACLLFIQTLVFLSFSYPSFSQNGVADVNADRRLREIAIRTVLEPVEELSKHFIANDPTLTDADEAEYMRCSERYAALRLRREEIEAKYDLAMIPDTSNRSSNGEVFDRADYKQEIAEIDRKMKAVLVRMNQVVPAAERFRSKEELRLRQMWNEIQYESEEVLLEITLEEEAQRFQNLYQRLISAKTTDEFNGRQTEEVQRVSRELLTAIERVMLISFKTQRNLNLITSRTRQDNLSRTFVRGSEVLIALALGFYSAKSGIKIFSADFAQPALWAILGSGILEGTYRLGLFRSKSPYHIYGLKKNLELFFRHLNLNSGESGTVQQKIWTLLNIAAHAQSSSCASIMLESALDASFEYLN